MIFGVYLSHGIPWHVSSGIIFVFSPEQVLREVFSPQVEELQKKRGAALP